MREKCTVDTLGHRRERHADRHLKPPEELERRFAAFPDAVAATEAIARACPRDFAERTFKQIEGFGSYRSPGSHAASFAKIAYASCWMKHHPDVF